jgi:hypothetical protein
MIIAPDNLEVQNAFNLFGNRPIDASTADIQEGL